MQNNKFQTGAAYNGEALLGIGLSNKTSYFEIFTRRLILLNLIVLGYYTKLNIGFRYFDIKRLA